MFRFRPWCQVCFLFQACRSAAFAGKLTGSWQGLRTVRSSRWWSETGTNRFYWCRVTARVSCGRSPCTPNSLSPSPGAMTALSGQCDTPPPRHRAAFYLSSSPVCLPSVCFSDCGVFLTTLCWLAVTWRNLSEAFPSTTTALNSLWGWKTDPSPCCVSGDLLSYNTTSTMNLGLKVCAVGRLLHPSKPSVQNQTSQ